MLFHCILFLIDTSKMFLTESSLGYTAGLFLIFFLRFQPQNSDKKNYIKKVV